MQRESRSTCRCNTTRLLSWSAVVLFLISWCSVDHQVESLVHHRQSRSTLLSQKNKPQSAALFAVKKKKKNRPGSGSSNGGGGFGGAAMESCPCGSGETYASCCGKLHRDVNSFRMATPEQVVRARYSAYAKKQPDFLMASTHPLNKNFDTDLKRWKDTIKENMYDNFDLSKCKIVQETMGQDEDTATVQFIAEMTLRETGETTSFMETSVFERAKTHGAWLYKSGTIEAAPGSDDSVDNTGSDDGKKQSIEEKLASML